MTGVAVSMLPWSQYSSIAMRMRTSAVLHNKISAWSELSPLISLAGCRYCTNTQNRSKIFQVNLLQTFKMVLQQEHVIQANLTDKVGPKTRKDCLAQQKEKIGTPSVHVGSHKKIS